MKEIGNNHDKYDLFAQDIPQLHIEGYSKLGSSVGCCSTVLLYALVFAYSCIRGRYAVTGDRPNISSFTVQNERNGTDQIDLNEYQFKVAFAIENILEEGKYGPADDPNFVEWYAALDNLKLRDTPISLHKCTAEDFADFHEIVPY